jgi:uncharacterized repeat protein (TIGR03843 family)
VPADQRTPRPDPLILLAHGEIEIQGRMPWSSNGTYLVTVRAPGSPPRPDDDQPAPTEGDGDDDLVAIYKPFRTERPLWDFPDGLYRREVAAYELDQALGWNMVPETVVREEGPLDRGSLQRFIDADFEQHYFTLLEDEQHHPALKRMAVFDVLANNADRKGGHCLLGSDGAIWGIDHGLCFHAQPKLRTVIWDFAGEAIGDDVVADVERLVHDGLPDVMSGLLHDEEADAVIARARALVRRPYLPEPRSDRPYPWPLV